MSEGNEQIWLEVLKQTYSFVSSSGTLKTNKSFYNYNANCTLYITISSFSVNQTSFKVKIVQK